MILLALPDLAKLVAHHLPAQVNDGCEVTGIHGVGSSVDASADSTVNEVLA
jgi:hypothetical protein